MEKQTKKCQNCKNEFIIEPEDFEFYEKIKVPAPTWCWGCRLKRRMCFRNERSLYKRKCDATGKDIISMYSPDKPFKIYDHNYWWSDKWDPSESGQDYDFSKPFFEQFRELCRVIPFVSISNMNATNSDYCNHADQNKDSYLVTASLGTEKVMYSNRITYDKDSLDLYIVHKSTFCYEDVSCFECYRLFFSKDCQSCQDSYFLYDCRNCQSCFGCANLRNKKYHIFNKPYTKEEYLKKIKEFDLGNFENLVKFKNLFQEIYSKAIHKYAHIMKSVNVIGDNIDNAKNCHYCFDVTQDIEDCKFCVWAGAGLKDTYDGGIGVGVGGELIYEAFDTNGGQRNSFIGLIYNSHNVQYALHCYGSGNLFGCVGLRQKQYCILNKQYSKQEYEELLPKIIEHMNKMPYIDKKGRVYKYGEFFPPELSPFAYNETIAQEYFPLTKEEALAQGYSWYDRAKPEHKPTIAAADLPNHIKDAKDDILNEIIQCANTSNRSLDLQSQCTAAFKIIPQELEFYRKMNLPLPRLCPNCRHYQRIQQRNPLKLWKRQCQCAGAKSENGVYANTAKHAHGDKPCPNEFQTTYAPKRPEIVYCEKCYLDEVV